ncbi:hypothetical protein ACKKBG_A21080 [Auxenochlorella protothecoides x Auxenochlorella symbiontica]
MKRTQREEGWLPRATTANVIGVLLFFCFVGPAIFHPPFPLPRLHAVDSKGQDTDASSRSWTGGFVQVAKNSHAYLRPLFPGASGASFNANVSSQYSEYIQEHAQSLKDTKSFMHEWIEKDMLPWKQDGITLEMLEEAENMYDICDGDMFRFQIISGKLYVYHVTARGFGWYPAQLGPGHVAAKGRVPYAMLLLLDVLRLFPGQIPDLDAVMQLGDFTCIAQEPGAGRTPVPMFGYTTSEGYADLVLPDFTYYGHEYDYLMDPWGNPAHGWPAQASVLLTKYANVSLASRLPQAMWRGRTMDSNYPHRDALRRAFLDCVRALRASGREDDAALLNVDREPIVMQDFDDYRYQVHIEPLAWVSNIRHKLAGGSVVMATGIKYYEWFARALVPGTHYVEIPARVPEMCAQAVDVVRDMNALLAREGGAGKAEAATEFELTPTLRKAKEVWATMPRLKELAKSAGDAEARSVELQRGGTYRWGSNLTPTQIAAAGQAFVRDKVRMQDLLLYTRDMLQAYAAAQRFTPAPRRKARCVDGAAMLEEFGTPYAQDAEEVAYAYPWLKDFDGGCANEA